MQYSLKMALRMINGTFEELDVYQFGNTGGVLDDDLDKTMVESWYKPADSQEEKRIANELNLPFAEEYQDVTTGSIVKNPAEIKLNETIVFYVFKVIVGKAFVMKKSAIGNSYSQNPRAALHPDYDSIYIQDDSNEGAADYVSHTYRVFSKESVRLLYKVKAKI